MKDEQLYLLKQPLGQLLNFPVNFVLNIANLIINCTLAKEDVEYADVG